MEEIQFKTLWKLTIPALKRCTKLGQAYYKQENSEVIPPPQHQKKSTLWKEEIY